MPRYFSKELPGLWLLQRPSQIGKGDLSRFPLRIFRILFWEKTLKCQQATSASFDRAHCFKQTRDQCDGVNVQVYRPEALEYGFQGSHLTNDYLHILRGVLDSLNVIIAQANNAVSELNEGDDARTNR